MHALVRRMASVAVGLACVTTLTVVTAPAAAAAPDCRAALVTVAGSGQRAGSPEMTRIADVVKADAAKAGTSVVVRAADYPAVAWWRYVQPGMSWNWDGLNRSEVDGVSSVLANVNALRRICSTRPILLAGYSQGADVVIRAVNSMGPIQRRTVSVALLGSPSFLPSLPQDRGTFDAKRRGIRPSLNRATFHLSPDVAPRAIDVCLRADSICNYYWVNAPNLANGTDAHYTYVKAGWADAIGHRLWAMRAGANITLSATLQQGTVSSPPYAFGIVRPNLVGAPSMVASAWQSGVSGIVAQKRTALEDWIAVACGGTEPAPYCGEESDLHITWAGRPVMASRYTSVVLLSTYYASGAGTNQNDADTLTMSMQTGRVLRLADVLNVSAAYWPLVAKMTARGVAPGGQTPQQTTDRCDFLGAEFLEPASLKDYTASRYGITFWFDRYEASYGACSQTSITMTWREVAPFLTAAGKDLRMAAAL